MTTATLGRFELQPLNGSSIWFARDPLQPWLSLVARTGQQDDARVYAEAQLLSSIGFDRPFRLLDIVLDDARGTAGYVLALPGPALRLAQATIQLGASKAALAICRGIEVLHASHIAYRGVRESGFVIAADCGIPIDLSRACQCDEDSAELLSVDIYDLGLLFMSITLSDAFSDLIHRMTDPDPTRRPDSIGAVIREFEHRD